METKFQRRSVLAGLLGIPFLRLPRAFHKSSKRVAILIDGRLQNGDELLGEWKAAKIGSEELKTIQQRSGWIWVNREDAVLVFDTETLVPSLVYGDLEWGQTRFKLRASGEFSSVNVVRDASKSIEIYPRP